MDRAANILRGYDVSAVAAIAAKVRHVYDEIQPRDCDPMLDFDERGLLALAEDAGFGEMHLDLQVSIAPRRPFAWDVVVNLVSNPRIPSLAEAMQQVLTVAEAERLTNHLRPLVEAGQGTPFRGAVAYLWAVKR